MVKQPEYPHNWGQFLTPVRGPLAHLSKLQLDLFDSFYRPDSRGLVDAFAWFGQGVLYDPRLADTEPVHTMSGYPVVVEYHTWFATLRGMMALGIDTHRWAAMAPIIGYAWALQSIAMPSVMEPNPGLPPLVVAEQAAHWLPKSYPAGI